MEGFKTRSSFGQKSTFPRKLHIVFCEKSVSSCQEMSIKREDLDNFRKPNLCTCMLLAKYIQVVPYLYSLHLYDFLQYEFSKGTSKGSNVLFTLNQTKLESVFMNILIKNWALMQNSGPVHYFTLDFVPCVLSWTIFLVQYSPKNFCANIHVQCEKKTFLPKIELLQNFVQTVTCVVISIRLWNFNDGGS